MMMLPAQGFAYALRRYDRGGLWWRGAPHTVKRTIDVLWGAPAPVYKGGEEEAAG